MANNTRLFISGKLTKVSAPPHDIYQKYWVKKKFCLKVGGGGKKGIFPPFESGGYVPPCYRLLRLCPARLTFSELLHYLLTTIIISFPTWSQAPEIYIVWHLLVFSLLYNIKHIMLGRFILIYYYEMEKKD